ncbi:HD domain-containing protein [bacterium]|nr:HD domain-containing protein [bacterium]
MIDLREYIITSFPEIKDIQDNDIREKTIIAFIKAIEESKWTPEEVDKLPFTLLIKAPGMTLINHIRSVTGMARSVAKVFNEHYEKQLNMDYIISGALLHDVGKFVEYTKDDNGKVIVSHKGKLIRHPFYGSMIAYEAGLPSEIINIIALHSKEGEKNKRTPEAIIIHHCDFMNFEPFKE